jgi:hypothetical protein
LPSSPSLFLSFLARPVLHRCVTLPLVSARSSRPPPSPPPPLQALLPRRPRHAHSHPMHPFLPAGLLGLLRFMRDGRHQISRSARHQRLLENIMPAAAAVVTGPGAASSPACANRVVEARRECSLTSSRGAARSAVKAEERADGRRPRKGGEREIVGGARIEGRAIRATRSAPRLFNHRKLRQTLELRRRPRRMVVVIQEGAAHSTRGERHH